MDPVLGSGAAPLSCCDVPVLQFAKTDGGCARLSGQSSPAILRLAGLRMPELSTMDFYHVGDKTQEVICWKIIRSLFVNIFLQK